MCLGKDMSALVCFEKDKILLIKDIPMEGDMIK